MQAMRLTRRGLLGGDAAQQLAEGAVKPAPRAALRSACGAVPRVTSDKICRDVRRRPGEPA